MRAIRTVLIGTIMGILFGMGFVHLDRIYTKINDKESITVDNMNDNSETIIDLNKKNNVTNAVIRFHIRANSNDAEDQKLKLYVKEGVINYIEPLLEDSKSIDESKEIIEDNMDDIREIALDMISEQGYSYDVNVYLTEEEFPIKEYGDMVFPAGIYQALRIDIGEGNGDNWWCVMFPPLCFIDATSGVVPEESKEEIKNLLTEEEYTQLLLNGQNIYDEDIQVEAKFKIVEELEKLFK